MTPHEADNFQNWKGMDGAHAWHLIFRHAEDWSDIGEMMEAWLRANSFVAAHSSGPSPVRGSRNTEGWISVDERLPDDMNAVLVYVCDNECEWAGAIVSWRGPKNSNTWRAELLEGEELIWKGPLHGSQAVTHWMPLPEPPPQVPRALVTEGPEGHAATNHPLNIK